MNVETNATIEGRLIELEAASDERRRALRAVLDDLPAAHSRRSMLQALGTDLRHAPNKGDIAVRALRKAGRALRSLVYRVRRSVQRRVARR
jgi:hypothetical protein